MNKQQKTIVTMMSIFLILSVITLLTYVSQNQSREKNISLQADSFETDSFETTEKPTRTPYATPKPTPSKNSNSSSNSSNTKTSSSQSEYEKIKEFAKREWGTDTDMVDYEYDKQISSYNYYLGLPSSKIKEYAKIEWTDGHGYTDWSMVEYEYKKQKSSYDYIQTVNCSQSIINKWTESGYTDWSMVEYEYRK